MRTTARELLLSVTRDCAQSKVRRRSTAARRGAPVRAEVSPSIIPFSGGEELIQLISGSTHQSYRSKDYSHVSDIIHTCQRAVCLSDRHGLPMPNMELSPTLSITFAQGDSIHDYVKAKVAGMFPSKVYGIWKCRCGGLAYEGTLKTAPDTVCSTCNTKGHVYDELHLENEEYRVKGHVDLTLVKKSALLFTEIKSISAKGFDELDYPMADHVVQICLYWWLAKEAGRKIHDKVTILYVRKEYRFQSPYKEFVLTPSKLMSRIEPYLEDALARANFIRGSEELPMRVCPKDNAPKARKCHAVTLCFGD